jgi:hypothetical protein
LQPDGLYVAARQIATDELRDPFLQQTVERVAGAETVLQLPRTALGRTTAAAAPAGIVFHVGRCGSTLVSQMLRACPQVVVYSEPQVLNELLLPPHPWPRAEMVAALRSLAPVFAQHARQPYVFKLSSWNTLLADLLLEAFPSAPWVFCVRDPLEVAVSLLREAPGWLRVTDGPASRLAELVGCGSVAREEFLARFFAQSCAAIEKVASPRGALVPYDSLPDATSDTVAPHFGLSVDADTRTRMSQVATQQAKAPLNRPAPFVPDSAAKRDAASETLRDAVDRWARPALARLLASSLHPAGR